MSIDNPNGALVAASWAAGYGLGIGDELLLDGAKLDTPPLTIVGLLADTGVGAENGGAVILLAGDTLNAAFDLPSPVTAVDLAVEEGRMDEVQAGLDRSLTEPFTVETVADAAAAFGRAQAGFSGIAFLLGLVALSAAAFLVANTLTMTLTERTREIGLLRAAGATGAPDSGPRPASGARPGGRGLAARPAAGHRGGGHPGQRRREPACGPRHRPAAGPAVPGSSRLAWDWP